MTRGHSRPDRFRVRGTWSLRDGTTLTLTFAEFASDNNGNGTFEGDDISGPPSPPNNTYQQWIAFVGENTFTSTDVAPGAGEVATTYTSTRF